MSPEVATRPCHRCLQPVPLSARRCPHCGDFQKADARRLMIYLGIAGIVGVLALVGLGLYISPSSVDLDNHPEARQQTPPPKPAKKPPLD